MVIFSTNVEVDVDFCTVRVYSGERRYGSTDQSYRRVLGICDASVPGALSLMTGTTAGKARFRVEVLTEEPEIEDEWDDIVEVPFHPLPVRIALAGLHESMGSTELPLEDLDYRVRYSALGAPAAFAVFTEAGKVSPDRYLLQFWPADREAGVPERIIRERTLWARRWNQEARRRDAVNAGRQGSSSSIWAGIEG